MSVTHERVAVAASSIFLLRADDCLQRFHAAWVRSGHPAALGPCPLYPQDLHRRPAHVRFLLPAQPVDATQALTLSAGASKTKFYVAVR